MCVFNIITGAPPLELDDALTSLGATVVLALPIYQALEILKSHRLGFDLQVLFVCRYHVYHI